MNILAVSAHPDDETLGCGGTLLKHGRQGDTLDWLVVTKPTEERFGSAFIDRRRGQIRKIQEAYGFRAVHQLEFPAAELESQPFGQIVESVSVAIRVTQPDRVYVVFPGDVHSDHRVAFEATWAALKPFSLGRAVDVFCYETPSSTDLAPPMPARVFLPNAFSDISEFIERKLEIFGIYDTEVQAPPGPRSIEAVTALARSRGAKVGVLYAEAFATMRLIF